MFKGDDVGAVINVLIKIASFEEVSGLKLNLTKCEFIAINCDEGDINEFVARTGMKRVQKLKHLWVWINEDGEVTEVDNIAPILEHMEALLKRYATSG